MNKILLFSLIALSTSVDAGISFNGESVKNAYQNNGSTYVGTGKLALYIEAVGAFSAVTSYITDGLSLTTGTVFGASSTFGDPNTFRIFAVKSTQVFFGGRIFVESNITGVDLGTDVESGNQFGVLYFQDSNLGASNLTLHEYYGVARESDWVIPAADGFGYDFGSGLDFTPVASATADQQVQAVPEPSAFAGMFGLMALLLAGRRRA